MSEDHFSNQRKPPRPAITNTAPAKQLVRPRPGSPSRDTQEETRPAKRTRKAINCEPCRNSKLKCDRSVWIKKKNDVGTFFILLENRNRPCSSCVLRGKSLFLAFRDSQPNFTFSADGGSLTYLQVPSRHAIKALTVTLSPATMRELNPSSSVSEPSRLQRSFALFVSNVDPTAEIARIRHSLSLLETHVLFRGTSTTPTQEPSSSNALAGPVPPPSTPTDPSARENIPGIYGRHGHRGYYAGPTSAASHILMVSQKL